MAHPVDVHVGQRLKAVRLMRDMSQSDVAARLGVSFQQIQKYETGNNRISASRLFELARIFNISPGDFFEGLDGAVDGSGPVAPEDARIVHALARIADPRTKSLINALITEIATGREARLALST